MMVDLWRRAKFQPVALAATDILTGLQTGMIDVIPTPPLAALTLQWFRTTPNMLGEGLAPLIGATVITKKTWDSFTPRPAPSCSRRPGRPTPSWRRRSPCRTNRRSSR